MSKARIPSRTALETAAQYVRDLGYDDRGFSLTLDGTITILPANKPGVSSDYDRWQKLKGAQ
jgi:hypothetical protein